MKKQLIALAAVAALSGSVFAADVMVYGAVDTGINVGKTTGEKHTAKMNSGILGPSKWGLKGSEDLGNGYGVSFRLESPVGSDEGTSDGFRRETRLTLETPYGELSFGRMGALTSSAGYYEQNYMFDIYDGGWGVTNDTMGGSMFFGAQGRWDNMVTYATPKVAGFTAYLQYSLQHGEESSNYATTSTHLVATTDETATPVVTVGGVNFVEEETTTPYSGAVEGKSSSDRYAGLAVTYANGPLNAVLILDGVNRANTITRSNARAVTFGGNYDFGVCTMYGFAQYGENQGSIGGKSLSGEYIDGYNLHVGSAVPAFGGTVKVAAYYSNGEGAKTSERKIKAYNFAASYEYPLSKRTTLYTGAGYLHQKVTDGETSKTKSYDVSFGLSHAF